jgi:uncharacterized protein YjcR
MPKNQKKTGRQNYDWAKIQLEYVTDPHMTLRKIAEKHGINYVTVAKKSKAEGWFATRKEHQSRVISKAISETEDIRAKAVALETDYLRMLTEHLGEILKDKDQFHRHLVTSTQGVEVTTSEEVFNKADTRAMKDSFQMLKMMDELSLAINSLERIENIRKHELDAERLQLDREKFEWEKQKAEYARPDSSNSIRIEGFEEGWAE